MYEQVTENIHNTHVHNYYIYVLLYIYIYIYIYKICKHYDVYDKRYSLAVLHLNPTVSLGLSYSYITSTSRISLLLHETKGEARGRVLITMISYECL